MLALPVLLVLAAAPPPPAQQSCEQVRSVQQLAAKQGVDLAPFAELEQRYCKSPRAANDCTSLVVMGQLVALSDISATWVGELENQQAISCRAGLQPRTLDWMATGEIARTADGSWFYPNGAQARAADGSWLYPDGTVAKYPDGTWRYPNGAVARFPDGSWRTPDGRNVGLDELLQLACSDAASACGQGLQPVNPSDPASVLSTINLAWNALR